MKIALDYGHNSPPDTGANGIKFEDDLVRELGNELVPILESMGHDIIFTQPKKSQSVNHSLTQRCNTANAHDADIFVSLHFNSFNSVKAQGTEVWVTSDKSKVYTEAKIIASNIAKLGFVNRGVKCGTFKVLKGTNMPAILIEGCFISSQSDVDKFDAKTMASAIANGLVGNLTTPPSPVTATKEHGKLNVTEDTILKPSTEQSVSIPKASKLPISVGTYGVTLLGDEEEHYLVRFDEGFDGKSWFIYHGHSKFLT